MSSDPWRRFGSQSIPLLTEELPFFFFQAEDGIRDDVHLVTAPPQLEPQLGRHGTGAAVGGITRDADSHEAGDGRGETGDVVARQRCTIRAASTSAGSVASRVHTCGVSRLPSPGPRSWFLNHVSCRFAYRRVARSIASRNSGW